MQKGASVQLRPASKVSALRNVAPKKTVKTTIVAQAVAEAEYAVHTGTAARKVLRIGKAFHEPPSTCAHVVETFSANWLDYISLHAPKRCLCVCRSKIHQEHR